MTVLQLARKIAKEEGLRYLREPFIEYVLWEETGYPSFFQPPETLESQLHDAFRKYAQLQAKE